MLMAWPNMFTCRLPHPGPLPQAGEGALPFSRSREKVAAKRRDEGKRQSSSHPQRLVQPVHPPGELRIGEGVDDPAVLHDEKPVGQRRGEAEILLDEQDCETL